MGSLVNRNYFSPSCNLAINFTLLFVFLNYILILIDNFLQRIDYNGHDII
jgi:hypothetical protein